MPARKKGKGGLIIGIVVLVVLLVAGAGVVGFLVLRDDDGGGGGGAFGGSDSPGDVVEGFFNAAKDRDCDIFDYYSEDTLDLAEEGDVSKEKCEDDPEEFFGAEDDEDLSDCEIEITDETEDGDTANVEYEVTGCADSDDNDEGEFDLVKEDGDWKIDLTAVAVAWAMPDELDGVALRRPRVWMERDAVPRGTVTPHDSWRTDERRQHPRRLVPGRPGQRALVGRRPVDRPDPTADRPARAAPAALGAPRRRVAARATDPPQPSGAAAAPPMANEPTRVAPRRQVAAGRGHQGGAARVSPARSTRPGWRRARTRPARPAAPEPAEPPAPRRSAASQQPAAPAARAGPAGAAAPGRSTQQFPPDPQAPSRPGWGAPALPGPGRPASPRRASGGARAAADR